MAQNRHGTIQTIQTKGAKRTLDLGGYPPRSSLDFRARQVDDGVMAATRKSQGADKSQQADGKPVDKKPRPTRRMRYVNMTNKHGSDVPGCIVCGACRYYISKGTPSSARMFTPHTDKCYVPNMVFQTPERLEDYGQRKAHFLTHFAERISR